MWIIYKSFLKKKVTKIYLGIFILFSLAFSFLYISRNSLIEVGNEAYKDSYLYFSSKEEIDLSKEKRIKEYNKAIQVDCNNSLTSIFITDTKPVIENMEEVSNVCSVYNYTINYTHMIPINLIQNDELYRILDREQNEYYYFVLLNNWFDVTDVQKDFKDKYKIEISIEEIKIDSNDYKNVLFIFNFFIKILVLLFIVLFVISIVNILVDEKRNHILYYYIGYSKLKILQIIVNKILIILFVPLCILLLTLCIMKK